MKYRAEDGGERASAAQQKSARFHGLPDSEMYTTEYYYEDVEDEVVMPFGKTSSSGN